jgi:hypothetical protein
MPFRVVRVKVPPVFRHSVAMEHQAFRAGQDTLFQGLFRFGKRFPDSGQAGVDFPYACGNGQMQFGFDFRLKLPGDVPDGFRRFFCRMKTPGCAGSSKKL